MRHNSLAIDTMNGLLHFPHLTMQIMSAAGETIANIQSLLNDDTLTEPPRTTKTITSYVDHPSDWKRTSTVTPPEKFTETISLLICHTMSTIIDKKAVVRVTYRTESVYSIKRNIQISEFSLVTPDQSKFVKPLTTPILNVIREGYPNLTTYLNEILRANKPEQ